MNLKMLEACWQQKVRSRINQVAAAADVAAVAAVAAAAAVAAVAANWFSQESKSPHS